MKLAVFGASGGTGIQVVRQALSAGHEVTAVARSPQKLSTFPGAKSIEAGFDQADRLDEALRRQDAVISALGPAARGPSRVCTEGVDAIIAAMRRTGVRRLVAVSAYGARDTHDRSAYSLLVWASVREKMIDKESMEAVVEASGLDWTVVRPPALTDGRRTGRYRTGSDLPIRPWSRISRADLAHFLIAEAGAPSSARFPRIAA